MRSVPPDLLPSPKLQRVKQFGKQYYINPEGLHLPSVSTVLNATRPPEQHQALADWKMRVGAEAAQQISSAASRRGTGTHKQVHRYLLGQPVEISASVRPYWDSLQPVLDKVQQIRLTEGLVFHNQLGYGGVVDCVAGHCIYEWKTADRPKLSLERLYDYPLQLAAYWGAVNYHYDALGIELHQGLLAVALPDQSAEQFWFSEADIAPYWDQWCDRLAKFWRRRGGFPAANG
jgi:hypothetical protein